jgi:hypothetical protein
MIDSDLSALAAEIHYTNVELYGVPAGDRNAQDAALRQAHGQHADLLDFAAQWDAAAADERAAWRAQATDYEIALTQPRSTLTPYQKYLHDKEYE